MSVGVISHVPRHRYCIQYGYNNKLYEEMLCYCVHKIVFLACSCLYFSVIRSTAMLLYDYPKYAIVIGPTRVT